MFGILAACVTIVVWERSHPATFWRRHGLQAVKLVSDLIGASAGCLAAWVIAQTLGWNGAAWQAAIGLGVLAGRASVEPLRAGVPVSR